MLPVARTTIAYGSREILAAELDTLLSSVPNTHFITAPVFGAPAAAAAAQLIVIMSGDYRSKKEVSHILHPAVGRKLVDLGGNVEKGMHVVMRTSTYVWLRVSLLQPRRSS